MKNENARIFSMIKWLGGVTAGLVFFAVCIAAHADDQIIDLKGIWSGYVIRHVTQNGFVPFYSGMRLVIEEQKGPQFKGHLINSTDRIQSSVPFTGAIDLNNEYLYLRHGSRDVCVGQITAGNCLILFVAGSGKDTATVFKLRKTAAP